MIIFFVKKRFVLCLLIIILAIVSLLRVFTEGVYAKESLSMYSGSYALTDALTDRVLTGKKETEPMANASTTKILTCIVALENSSLEEYVTISKNAASQPKVRLGMGEGEQYPLKDMLYGLMLESYNDCAVAIAEHVAGSEEAFSKMLNHKAKEIGCKNTYFITPNGLDAEDETNFHHTTAEDLCRMMSYCVWKSPMKDVFLEITQTPNFTGTANGSAYTFVNHNSFLNQMEGVLSGKTGFTSKAGYCYVAAFEKDGERYCIALLACGWPNNKTYKWQDARVLLDYATDNYDLKQIKIKEFEDYISVNGYILKPRFEELNKKGRLKLTRESKIYEVLLGKEEEIKQEIVLYTDTALPIEKGQKLGVCNLYINDLLYDQLGITASTDSNEWQLKEILQVILFQFLTFSS